MKGFQVMVVAVTVLASCGLHAWDVEFVGKNIVTPCALATQELLYIACAECYDWRLDRLLQWTQSATMHPQLTLSSSNSQFELRNGNHKRNMFTLVVTRSLNDSVLELFERVTRGRHSYLNLVVMYEPVTDFAVVERLLLRLHRGRFVCTHVYYRNATSGGNTMFGFQYFPLFRIHNLTQFASDWWQVLHDLIKPLNVHGYRFRSPILQDAPKVIRYEDKALGRSVQGISYNILNAFMKHINGSLVEYSASRGSDVELSMRGVLNMVRSGEIEVAATTYELFVSDNHIMKSYPLQVVNWCLMVPTDNSVTTWFYPFLPFAWNVWIAVVTLFAALNVLQRLYPALAARSDLSNIFLQCLCQFINIPPPRAVTADSVRVRLIHFLLFIHGFYLSAFYTSMLGSILTVTLVHAQINSMADLIAAQLPVMIIDYEHEFLLSGVLDRLPPAFLALLRQTNYRDYHRHQLGLDTSYAYFVTDDTWHFINLQQQYLRHPIFKFSSICFGAYHQAFPMELESPVWRELEYFLYRVHSSGLHYYHASKSFDYAVQAGLVHRLSVSEDFIPVGMQHLQIVFVCHVLNLAVASVFFLIERYYYGSRRK